MKRRDFIAGSLGIAGLSVLGCSKKPETATPKPDVYKCPVCGQEMEKDAYCSKCNAIASLPGTFHCDKCSMDKKIGTYCGKCNRFLSDEEIYCETSKKTVVKGTFCEKKQKFRKLASVGYCQKCKKPYDAKTGCPTCMEQQGWIILPESAPRFDAGTTAETEDHNGQKWARLQPWAVASG